MRDSQIGGVSQVAPFPPPPDSAHSRRVHASGTLPSFDHCFFPLDFSLPFKLLMPHHHHEMKQYTEENVLAVLEAVVNGASRQEASSHWGILISIL
jgi:hypothetical protein